MIFIPFEWSYRCHHRSVMEVVRMVDWELKVVKVDRKSTRLNSSH